ncbi:penicillin-binding protein [Neobacillus notoginsengisoli]|uniref:serine-type D-Ala-D-Ala carboxypeptidase n=1 Tax=Neobacillus notoginsengisoli TaxID=1578198 RepID=A0A417YR69_9BACI|nr:penicillin-binding protein [Neobacillus notoginsengisoli]RHW36503.1 penicillin-binding protein [Neobacillus notoginsengisoli]
MAKKQPNMNKGAVGLFFVFSLLFFVILYRFSVIGITGEAAGQPLAAKAEQKHTRYGTIEAARGAIKDRSGEVIAEDTASYTLIAILDEKMTTDPENPKHIVNPEMTAAKLAKYIDMKESEIIRILEKKKEKPELFQVEFGKAGRDIPFQTKKEIEAEKLPGITFKRDSKRFYPNGIFASHLVGFVERKERENGTYASFGKLGIEKLMDKRLKGESGKIEYESDLWGYLLPSGKELVTPAKNGNDIYLTLDRKIQTFLEDALNKTVEEYNPKKIIAIVADPKTGEILAMGQRPTFDPKTREGIEKAWHNEAIEYPFEPGSTMKIFTLAAAVNEGVFKPNEPYKSGSYQVTKRDKPIKDHNGSGWGTITYLEGVQRSSNVAFAKMAKEKLGFDTFREYLTRFGLDKPTGIDLPSEATSQLRYEWPIEKITTSFGQGTAVTAIQQVQAATAIANDGKMMKPHVIKKITDYDTGETIEEIKPEVVSEPITPEAAKKVRDILETVITSPKGTGHNRYNIEGYSVAGKTGTAELSQGHGYLSGAGNYIFSFLGMAPADNPELIVYVAVQQPEIDSYFKGSLPVSMIFNSVMKNSLQYLNIKPSTQAPVMSGKLPDLKGEPAVNAKRDLEAKGYDVIVIGDGSEVAEQVPTAGATALEGEKVILKTNGKAVMPDMAGWSIRDVMKAATLTDLKLNFKGSGYVVKQSITKGAPIKGGDQLTVQLETPREQNHAKEKEKKDPEIKE